MILVGIIASKKREPDMTNRFSIFQAAGLLVLVGLACSLPFGNTDSDSDNQSETEIGILFSDDFSDKNSGWDQYSDTDAITDYENGIYRIYVPEPNYDYWANPGKSFTDVRVEVDATQAGGPDDNDFGVICRYKYVDDIYLVDLTNVSFSEGKKAVVDEMNHFYFFIISSDGYYTIGKSVGDDVVYIGQDTMLPSDDINTLLDTNHIRADCVGSELSLYVNGILLTTVTDSDFSSGDVGLMAGTYDTPGTDIYFDNFVVYDPAVKE
jgi:hypothetical protein